ncbi:hypothetical protein [Prevotella sp. oral taxon 820]|uniref:hypothetical protein n=1 Tax=Prevotella sp. oral taxon 820 TaxID=2081962 RepID=UPI001E4EEF95|nr:hypothetical protein [Prevotella sp. oral taxon 820]
MKPYKSVNRLWERERRTDDEVSGFITCKPIAIQRFRDFVRKNYLILTLLHRVI